MTDHLHPLAGLPEFLRLLVRVDRNFKTTTSAIEIWATAVEAAMRVQAEPVARFLNVSCSQCGREFGPGNFGFSHCIDHSGESYSKGIDAAAAWLDKRADDYDAEHGSTDPETGDRDYPGKGAGLDYYAELRENADIIRALKYAASPAQAQPVTPQTEMRHCNICGGEVDLSNATKPTARFDMRGGVKAQPVAQAEPPTDVAVAQDLRRHDMCDMSNYRRAYRLGWDAAILSTKKD